MAWYRRRASVIVEAVQFLDTPESRKAIEKLVDTSPQRRAIGFVGSAGTTLVIETPEGDIARVTPGDFVVRDVVGELYLHKPDAFLSTYGPIVVEESFDG